MMEDFLNALGQYIGKPVVEIVCGEDPDDNEEDDEDPDDNEGDDEDPDDNEGDDEDPDDNEGDDEDPDDNEGDDEDRCTQRKDRGLLANAYLMLDGMLGLEFLNSDGKTTVAYSATGTEHSRFATEDLAKLCALEIDDVSVGEIYHKHMENKGAEQREKEKRQKRHMDVLRNHMDVFKKSLDKDGVIHLTVGEINVCKKLLCNISPVFKDLFGQGSAVTITDHDPDGVRLFIDILCGEQLQNGWHARSQDLPTVIKLFHDLKCGRIANFVPDLESLVSEETAREMLQREGHPAFKNAALRKICWRVIGKKRKVDDEDEGNVPKRHKPIKFPIVIKNEKEYSALMSGG